MDTSPRSLLALSLLLAGCGAAVTPAGAPADADAGAVAVDAPAVTPTPVPVAPPTPTPSTASCAEVQASCGDEPQRFVRGHAAGLVGLEGARARFAMRYLTRDGVGLNVAHGVVSAESVVRGGAFEACVCMPRGGNEYPQLVGVVFAPGSAGEASRDVARASFSQRYATLGDEDLSLAFADAPSAAEVEAALAGLVDRAHAVRVRGLDAAMEGAEAFAGLLADERPVAAEVARGAVEGGALALEWIMPGRQWPTERLAVVIDRDRDRRCGAGDLGATVRLDGRAELDGVRWTSGAEMDAICAALSLGASRER